MSPKTTRPASEDVLLVDVLVLMGQCHCSLGASLGIPFWRALRTRQWLCLAKGESTLVRAGSTESTDFSATRDNRQKEMETLSLIALVMPLSQLEFLAGQPRSSTPMISRA